jgi:putative oxidoreductase
MNLKRLGVWVLAGLLGIEFCVAGLSKFGASSDWPRMFFQWGFPAWFRPVIGAAEVFCGLALFVPRVRPWACSALLCIMAGATATHLVHGEPRRMILPVVLCAFVGLLGWVSMTRSQPPGA